MMEKKVLFLLIMLTGVGLSYGSNAAGNKNYFVLLVQM